MAGLTVFNYFEGICNSEDLRKIPDYDVRFYTNDYSEKEVRNILVKMYPPKYIGRKEDLIRVIKEQKRCMNIFEHSWGVTHHWGKNCYGEDVEQLPQHFSFFNSILEKGNAVTDKDIFEKIEKRTREILSIYKDAEPILKALDNIKSKIEKEVFPEIVQAHSDVNYVTQLQMKNIAIQGQYEEEKKNCKLKILH